MKKLILSNEYISAFCLQIALLLHAGINLADGIHMLAEDESDNQSKELLIFLAEQLDEGIQLSNAMEETGCFPDYVINMAATGEGTGRTEQAYKALADYYNSQKQLNDRIRSALVYPVVLLFLMLIIIGILLIKVLPIFNKVYNQLGSAMEGMAGGLLKLGQLLGDILPILGVVIGVFAVAAILILYNSKIRNIVISWLRKQFGEYGLNRKIDMARFASAFTMGMLSGLPMEEAMKLAAAFHQDVPKANERYQKCITLLEEGEPLAEAMREAKIFEPLYCRMLSLGIKSGNGDEVMEEITRRLNEDAAQSIEDLVSKVEPTIVIMTSMIVGIILIAVMLPLMNIMTTIG